MEIMCISNKVNKEILEKLDRN